MAGLKDGYDFFTKDYAAERGNFDQRMSKAYHDLSMNGDIAAFRKAQGQAIKEYANSMLEDAGKLANGVMAVSDVVGFAKLGVELGKLGFAVGKGVINSSLVQCKLLQKACFAAGTPLHAPKGAQLIETFLASGGIVTRDENKPKADARLGMVDEIFKLTARIWELHIGGRVIETTAEHPFYLVGPSHVGALGWTPLCRLKPGDLLLGRGPVPTAVERVVETNRTTTVYNLRVEPDHTFFVGGDDWGFSLWAHNAPCLPVTRYLGPPLGKGLMHGGAPHNSTMVKRALAVAARPGVTGVRANQALVNVAGKTISRLRPDVQYIENGLVHIIEVSTLKGAAKAAYHARRRLIFKAILGSDLGSYLSL